MKKLYFLLVLMSPTLMLFSQTWLKNLPQKKFKGELTFFDYKNAFNKYWTPFNVEKGYYYENGVKKKAEGWKQFKRWEYYMENQINPTTGEFPKKTAQEIYEKYLKANPNSKSRNLADWTCLGTNSSDGGYAGVGRINCISFHPSDNNTYWAGAASGGLWVTMNNGSSWNCLTDNNGILAVSDIVIPTDYATSNTIYVATGDKDHWDNRSIGVLKSTNGGSTWNTTGLSYVLSGGSMVNKLLLDPNNNQTIIAATSNGVYKTTNGGTNWSTQLTSIIFIDMEYNPGDFNTLYGSTQYDGTIYLSTNGGASWAQSFNDANAYRIELTVSANQPTWVYAVTVNSDNGLYGIYKSTNSGLSFSKVFDGATSNLLGGNADGSSTSGQGWYDLSIAVSPSNANTLLVGGINTWRSTNGGTAWSIVNHWWGDGVQAVHADKHMLKYRSSGNLFECNDGGIYISTNNGTSWTDKTDGMVISQMYKLGNSTLDSNEIITGLQDNGTKLLYDGTWYDVYGGDGMECLIDYTDDNIQYETYVYGEINRTTDLWNSTTEISANIPGGADGAWVTPYIIDPNNPQILYVGYSDIWKTMDRGDNWSQISTMNTSDKIRSMAIAPSNTQYLYVADRTHLWKTTNGGTSWADVTGTLPVGSGSITNMAVKDDDANTLWVTMSGYNANRVYQSTNGGTSWTNISTGLPQIPAYTIVQYKKSTSEVQLYVGTELGVYFKKDSDNWIAYNTGLPNVKIGEMEIYYATLPQNDKLRAATYGRGLWESPVYCPLKPNVIATGGVICNGASININASGANTYTWNNGSSTNPLNVSPTITTSYTVTGTDMNGCANTAQTLVTINSNPTVIATGNTICNGASASIAASGANTYTWVNPLGAGNPKTVSPTTNTTYFVTGTDANGCTGTAQATVAIYPSPTITVNSESILQGQSATLCVSGGSTYSWSTTETSSCISVTPNVTSTYTVTGTDANGCTGTTQSIVTVNSTFVNNISGNNNELQIYPNPNNGLFILQKNNNTSQKFQLTIKTIQGQEVLKGNINFTNTYPIDLQHLAGGVYIITLQNDKENYVSRVVVQR
ncbi:MAG: T9SS type A sorting domain-containing protein [Bacteroidales bacterium]|jgi:photosystem II stability/assembly factor-like uncharacterized protein